MVQLPHFGCPDFRSRVLHFSRVYPQKGRISRVQVCIMGNRRKVIARRKVTVSCLGTSPVKTPLPKLTLKTHKSTPTVAEDLSIDRVIVKRNIFVFGHKDSTWLV